MRDYKNIKTGQVISTIGVVSGEDWVELKKLAGKKATGKQKADDADEKADDEKEQGEQKADGTGKKRGAK